MIINCINCNKKFDVDSDLIPKNGRLLICSGCNHEWFYEKENLTKKPEILIEHENFKSNVSLFQNLEEDSKEENNDDIEILEANIENVEKQKKIKFLNLTLVFIISFVSLIVLMDTFKDPISKLIPSIEFILYNLYESVTDIILFLNDLF